ncbi:WD40 repeat domain-containing protein [Xenorhabdus thailandensis]|uniref:WD40 repeat domain-containing protein n=1 Tax=Xenorhabdus thailandensis TaxID=3136255 RepID=UPI0030F43320
MIAHYSPISGISAYRDKYVLTAGYDNQIILWDAKTKRPVARAMHDHLANQGAFSPDGNYAVTSSSDYSARLWTIPDLRLVAVLADHDDDVEMSVFHPHKPMIATASRDHNVRVYDFSGKLLYLFKGHSADVISVAWMYNADELVSSSDDGTIKRWSLAKNDLVADIDLNGIETDTIAIATDGHIFAGNDEGEIISIAPDGMQEIFTAHNAGVKRLVLDHHRGLLVSLSYDRTMRLWQVDVSGQLTELISAIFPPEVWPRSCSFEGDDHLVFATFQASYRQYNWKTGLWDTAELAPTHGVNAAVVIDGQQWAVGDAGIVWVNQCEHTRIGSLCNFLVPVGDMILTGGQLGKTFDACSGRELYQHRSPLNCGVAFKNNGTDYAVIGTYTGEGIVLRIDRSPDRHLQVTHITDLPLHANAVKDLAISDDLLFSIAADASATWYRLSTLEPLYSLKHAHEKIANGCTGLGEGYFASVSRDLKLRIWSPSYEADVIATPHTHSIKCVTASVEGRYVATGSYNGRISIYDRLDNIWVFNERITTSGVSSLRYDVTTQRFIASSYDGNVYIIPFTPQDYI